MLEPVGPLPAAVYWRRRCVALASAVTLAALVVATAGAPTSTPVPAANRVPTTVASTAGTTPAAGPVVDDSAGPAPSGAVSTTATGAAATGVAEGTRDTAVTGAAATGATPDGTAPAGAIAGADASSSTAQAPPVGATGTPSGTATSDPFSAQAVPGTTTERIRPDDTPRLSAAAQPSVPVPPSGPVPCTNAMLSAAAELDHPVHRVGSHPVLRLVITNTSGQPCVRDLDSARQEIVVWSADGATRLWSSNDCVNASSIDLRTLVPGRPVAFAVTWGERTTTPGCRQPRTLVPAGTYRLMVRLDNLISPPTPFIRTP
jgi:hypothetical protein